jgi:hypothetical protein
MDRWTEVVREDHYTRSVKKQATSCLYTKLSRCILVCKYIRIYTKLGRLYRNGCSTNEELQRSDYGLRGMSA